MRWQIVLSWLVAAACALLAARRLRLLVRLDAPDPAQLLRDLLAEAGASGVIDGSSDFAQRAAIAELNQRLADVSFELALLPARFTALTRICLASGTALALFAYIGEGEASALERVVTLASCAAGGLVGAACVLAIGRMAKQRSALIRQAWDRSSREAGKSLGTSLESIEASSRVGRGR